MNWTTFRLSTRLNLKPQAVEEVYAVLSEIDGVKNSWTLAGALLPQTIERLTRSVVVTSTGASNRIEGNLLSDDEVEALYRTLHIRKFASRDEQEVAGYLEVLQQVFAHYQDMAVRESTVCRLHEEMLKYSDKDQRHKGQYKFTSNRVEARDRDGNVVGVIFEPTPPHLTQKEMYDLLAWHDWAFAGGFKHPLILIANFIFEYLAIHPFQDGNGRTSRLLTNLLLLRHGYGFASVVSHERLIEARKTDYYLALNKTQSSWKTRSEDIASWLSFFLGVVQAQAQEALRILEGEHIDYLLSEKQAALWRWINDLPPGGTFSRKDAVAALGFPVRTVEAGVKKLLEMKKLERLGQGRATCYRVRP